MLGTYFLLLGNSILLYLVFFRSTIAAENNPTLRCNRCSKPGRSKHDCDGVESCSKGEVCYAQITEIVHFGLFSAPEKHYYSGCIQANKCTNVHNSLLEPDGTWESQKPLCGGCCSDSECNGYLCDIHDKGKEYSFRCNHCSKPGRSKSDCDGVEVCSDGEVCYAQITEIVHFGLFGAPAKHYYSGCVQTNKCNNVHNSLLEPDGTYESRKPLCGGCCSHSECNRYLCGIHERVLTMTTSTSIATTAASTTTITTTPATTTPTTTPSSTTTTTTTPTTTTPTTTSSSSSTTTTATSTTTTPPTTTSSSSTTSLRTTTVTTTTSTPTTSSTTTISTTTTSTPSSTVITTKTSTPSTSLTTTISTTTITETRPLECEVCRGASCSLIPHNDPVIKCTEDMPFCMNIVDNADSGLTTIMKRCASPVECENKWLKESLLKSECIGFIPGRNYTFNFTCHYCCTTDICNTDLVPKINTLYTGTR